MPMRSINVPVSVIVFLVVLISGCSLFKSEDTVIKDYTVTYRVFGDHAISNETTITYKNESGVDSVLVVNGTTWQYEFTASTGTQVYIKAFKSGGGTYAGLHVAIDLDGEVWKTGYCRSEFCSISREGNLP